MDTKLLGLPEKDARIFFFLLYAEDTFKWVRRQDTRFAVDKTEFIERFKPSKIRKYDWVDRMFQRMQDRGWIASYRHDKITIRFTLRLPSWLQVSPYAKLTERYVPKSRHYGEDESTNLVIGQGAKYSYVLKNEKEAYQQLQDELAEYEAGVAVTIEQAMEEKGDI